MDRAGDDSRPKESGKLAGLNSSRYLVTVHEALGLTYTQILDSGMAIIDAMMQEYSYICHERNKAMKGENTDASGGEWVELPDFENGGMKRIKKGSL